MQEVLDLARYEYHEQSPYLFHTEEAIQKSKIGRGKVLTKVPGFSYTKAGYMYACVKVGDLRINNPVHRVVWELHNGPVPEGLFIDHKDGDVTNNSITNLRLCTKQQNEANKKPSINSTGYTGVRLTYTRTGQVRYKSRIRDQYGVDIHLGTWLTPLEAHLAYVEKHKEIWQEFSYFNREEIKQAA